MEEKEQRGAWELPREEPPLLPPPEEPIDLGDSLPPRKDVPPRHFGIPIVLALLLCMGLILALLLMPVKEQSHAVQSTQTDGVTDATTDTDRIIFIRDEEDGDGLLTPQEIYESALTATVSVICPTNQTVGSGFLYGDGSFVVTTCEALRGEVSPQIGFSDQTRLPAQVVATNAFADLALLKIERTHLSPLPVCNSEVPLAGDAVYTLGCTDEGSADTFLSGTVSHPERRLTLTDDRQIPQKTVLRIQTSFSASTGFGGSPLLNEKGQVVGILTCDGEAAYAIPISGAVPILDAMLRGETPSDSLLASVSIPMASLGVVGDADRGEGGIYGVRIRSFSDGESHAAKALAVGDLITHVESTPVTNASALEAAIRPYAPGQVVSITVRRNGQSLTFPIVLTRNS